MSRLPSLTPKRLVAALKRAGFSELRQRGSHLHLYHPTRDIVLTVPMHCHDLPRGTLKAILNQAEISEEELRTLL